MKKHVLLVVAFALLLLSMNGQSSKSASKSVETQVTEIMNTMSLDDKIGQMIIADFGILHNNLQDIATYKIGNILFGGDSDPNTNTAEAWADICDSLQRIAISANQHIPLFLATDAIHGHSNVSNATIFPQNIAMGCTRNTHLISEQGRITASEVAATGIRLAFTPHYVVPRDERWGGIFEGYSENPVDVKKFGKAYLEGFNSVKTADGGMVLACPKYSGDVSFNNDAVDVKNSIQFGSKLLPLTDSIFIESGAIMISSFQFANNPKIDQQFSLVETLKKNTSFKGMIVSDWELVNTIHCDYHTIVKNAINAGIDLFTEPSSYKQFIKTMKQCVTNGEISKERIDDAVKRILTQKIKIGLMNHPLAYRDLLGKIGDKGRKNIVRQCVRESAVILLNKNNILPISKKAARIHVAGSAANNMAMQCGGWTIGWQGLGDNVIPGKTMLEALKQAASGVKISYSKNGQGATGSELGIVVIGENPYAEWYGNKKDLSISQEDINAVVNIKNANVPVVCIILSGRPLILDPIIDYCDAIVASWLPGPEIEGLTDILMGEAKPSGLLSQSWPLTMNQIAENYGEIVYNPLFPYQTGITTLEITKYRTPRLLSANVIKKGGAIELAFSRPISTFNATDNFSITTAGKTQKPVSGELKPDNAAQIILALKDSIKANQKVSLNFEIGVVKSKDGEELLPFKNFNVFNPYTTLKKIYHIPAMIQAEKYSDQKDIEIQDCWDDKGGQAIALEKNEWVEYVLTSTFPGYYTVNFRIQSTKKTEISLSLDGREIGTANVPATKEGTWKTVEMKNVYITNGKQTFTVYVKGEACSINWISFYTFVNFTESK